MRVFTGIRLDSETKEKIESELRPFKKMAAAAPIRWVNPDCIHLTLKFIGEVADRTYPALERALSGVRAGAPCCRLRIRGFGKFPPENGLAIFWAGVEAGSFLSGLFERIEAALQPLGIPTEARPFSPHITLGRNKANADFRVLIERMAASRQLDIAELTVDRFQIFKSQLTPQGPIHSVLKEIPFA